VSTGLIVAGVVLFLLIDAYVLYRFMYKRHKTADDFAEIPVPGETQIQLQAGKVKITYHESHRSSSDEDRIHFSAPGELKVEVTGGSTGAPLEMNEPGFRGMGSSKSTGPGYSRDVIGTVEVTEPGIYTVTVSAPPQDPELGAKVLVGK
jgi:hypothetical protein